MESIRKLQFMVKGYRQFNRRQTPLPPLPPPSKQGFTFVITGANSGIGFAAALTAAKLKASVYLVCRSEARGKQALDKIKQQTGNNKVFLVLGQMGTRKEMDGVVEQLKNQVGQIDVLVHNAGCMLHTAEYTEEKLEKNYATNTFAIYYLTSKCMPLLHDKSRIIAVASGGMLTQKLVTDDIFMTEETFDGTKQYARNKRQQIAIMEHFGRTYPQKGKFVSMHPGWVDTLAVRTAMPDFYNKMKDKLKDENEGADTIVWLSVVPFEQLRQGEFYFDRQVADKHLLISCTTYNDREVDRLIDVLKKQSGEL